MLTLLLPENRFPAIEERYGQWQSELLLTRETEARIVRYHPDTPLQSIERDGNYVAIVTNPLFVARTSLLQELVAALESTGADAAVPVLNDAPDPERALIPPRLYLTLGQFEEVATEIAQRNTPTTIVDSLNGEPVVAVFRNAQLSGSARDLLRNRRTAVVRSSFVHLFASQRGQTRLDLLDFISPEASSILEFGCGEAGLGAALKARQSCRVVGVELDDEAAAIARTRIDALHSGDVRELVHGLDETFDTIIGGDIVEHLDEPWRFLSDLKRVARPGARLILSLPNIANWAVTSDLLRGRFDYVYLGILCAGHLRFFTRRSLEEMLTIAGWNVQEMKPQAAVVDDRSERFETALQKAGLDFSADDLRATGWYIVATL